MVLPLAAQLGIGLAGGFSGLFGGNDQRDELGRLQNAAQAELSIGALTKQFRGLQGLAAPTIGAIGAQSALASQVQGQSLQASFARQGLGSSGIGSMLGAGAARGSAFQSNQLRARIFGDLLGDAQNAQAAKAQAFLSQMGMTQPQPNAATRFLSGFGGGLSAGGSLFGQPQEKQRRAGGPADTLGTPRGGSF